MKPNNLSIWITFRFTAWFFIMLHPQDWFIIPSTETTGLGKARKRIYLEDDIIRNHLSTSYLIRHWDKFLYINFLCFTFRIKYMERTQAWYLVDQNGKLKVDSESDRYYKLLNECI